MSLTNESRRDGLTGITSWKNLPCRLFSQSYSFGNLTGFSDKPEVYHSELYKYIELDKEMNRQLSTKKF